MSKQSGSNPTHHWDVRTLAVELGDVLPIPLKPPSPKKYEKNLMEQIDRPDIERGMKMVVRINEQSDCKGYMGCVVLDWHDRGVSSRWSWNTTVIAQVLSASNPGHKEWVGRLISSTVSGWSSSFWGGFGIVEIAPTAKNWSKYQLETI